MTVLVDVAGRRVFRDHVQGLAEVIRVDLAVCDLALFRATVVVGRSQLPAVVEDLAFEAGNRRGRSCGSLRWLRVPKSVKTTCGRRCPLKAVAVGIGRGRAQIGPAGTSGLQASRRATDWIVPHAADGGEHAVWRRPSPSGNGSISDLSRSSWRRSLPK